MTLQPTLESRSILFGVTTAQSLKLLGDIPKAMVELGWNVCLVSGDTASPVPGSLSGIKIHRLPMLRNPVPLRDAFSLMRWIILLLKVKPAIVVAGTPKAALLGLLAALMCRVPIRIYQLRGLRLETASGATRLLLTVVEWVTAKCATSILAVSTSLKDEYCRLGFSEAKKIEVLGLGSSHGVDIHRFHPTKWSSWEPPEPEVREAISTKASIIGFVGRLSADKGAEELLLSCKILRASSIPFSLLIIGPMEGDDSAVKALASLKKEAVVIGPVEDVAPYYSIMDLLVLPTHREGFPNVVLEAAASGIPSVTTSATGAVDSVVPGKTGLLVPPKDATALADAIIRLITQPQLLQEFGDNARNWSISNFDSDHVTRQHSDYFMRRLTQET